MQINLNNHKPVMNIYLILTDPPLSTETRAVTLLVVSRHH